MRTFAQKQKQHPRSASFNINRSNPAASGTSHHASPLHFQRTIGNQAGRRLLQANTEGPAVEPGTTATTRFAHDFSRIPVYAEELLKTQTKLAVNTPGDVYEQEADRVADQVMRMADSQLQRTGACGGGRPKCKAEQLDQEHKLLQTKTVSANDDEKIIAPPIVHKVLRSPGQPIDSATTAFFEPRFGYDFSQVRVHTDGCAAEAAQAVQARAFTLGKHITFATGEYRPETHEGRRLLAHELTHVTQQGEARPGFWLQRHPKQTPFPQPCDYYKRNFYSATGYPPHCCTATMLGELRSLSLKASLKVQHARVKLIEQPASLAEPLRAHFRVNPSNPDHAAHLRYIAAQLLNMGVVSLYERAVFYCRDAGDEYCVSQGMAQAISTNCPGSTLPVMFFCGYYDGEPFLGSGWLKTVIHEYAHVGCTSAGIILDASNEIYKGQSGYPPPADQAVKNADSYAEFAMEVG